VTLELPQAGRQVALALRDPAPNPNLAESVFELPTPPGFREIELDGAAP
jgi:hypothetical protein